MPLELVYRIVVFVPEEDVSRLLEGVLRVTSLSKGRYDRVAFRSSLGTEQYRPLEGAHPASGEIGRLHRSPSVRLEFSIPRDRGLLDRVLEEGVVANHSWEEPVVVVTESMERRL